jgi:hypothetical protein
LLQLSDSVTLFEEDVAVGDVEHVGEQHSLQLSDCVVSFEEVTTGDVEHVWEQLLLQVLDIVASFEQHVVAGSVEHV